MRRGHGQSLHTHHPGVCSNPAKRNWAQVPLGAEEVIRPGFVCRSACHPLLALGWLCPLPSLPQGPPQEVEVRSPGLGKYQVPLGPGATTWPHVDNVPLSPQPTPRRQSGSFLSTGWFTMILALELCEEIVVYGMVSDSYCRSDRPGRARGDTGSTVSPPRP